MTHNLTSDDGICILWIIIGGFQSLNGVGGLEGCFVLVQLVILVRAEQGEYWGRSRGTRTGT